MNESADDDSEEKVREMALLGTAVLLAQMFEFALYGIVAPFSHLPETQEEKRFRELKPEAFLRGDPSDLEATLGHEPPIESQGLSPFKCFNSSLEVIRLVVMMYIRFPPTLRNV